MADSDTKESTPTTPEAKLDKVLALLQKWPGADADEPDQKDPKGEVPQEAHDAATRARKKYDGTLRWILGVFSAVGALIFGSLPFTDLKNVDPGLLFLGLLLAAAGLAIIIWATARGLELQDASLGELSHSFKTMADRSDNFYWPWVRSPRRKANTDLKDILQNSTEATAHLGPGIKTVEELIVRLGDLEARTMDAYAKWSGGDTSTDPRPTPLPGKEELKNSVAAKTALAASAKTELEVLEAGLAELRKQAPESDPDKAKVKAALAQTEERYRAILVLLPDSGSLEEAATSTAWDEIRDFYRAHRELVLDESLVAQMRGSFTVVLRWLIVGASLVAAGGVIYAYAIANPTSEGSVKNPVEVTLDAKSDALKMIVDGECVEGAKEDEAEALHALLVTSRDADGLQNGPFSFTPLAGACAGKTYDVDEGDGHYVGMAAAESTEAPSAGTTTEEPSAAWEPVTVTIFSHTPAWDALERCRTTDDDITDTPALLIDSDPADAAQDGAFEARLSSGPCIGELVTVDEGHGTYRAQR